MVNEVFGIIAGVGILVLFAGIISELPFCKRIMLVEEMILWLKKKQRKNTLFRGVI